MFGIAWRVESRAVPTKKGSAKGMTTSEELNLRPRFLMCRPQHFAVTYRINPWMDPAAWRESGEALHATAARQWQGLFRALGANGAKIETVEPRDGLPDLVFTPNSPRVLHRQPPPP